MEKREQFRKIWEEVVQTIQSLLVQLRSAQSKQFFTFLGFLSLSILFWFMLSIQDMSNSTYTVPLRYTHIPENTILLEELPQEVEVRLQDKASVLLTYWTNGFSPLEVDFNNYAAAESQFTIGRSRLSEMFQEQLKNSTVILSNTPDSISLYFTREEGKRLPLRFRGSITAAPQSIMTSPVVLNTDSVTLFAPRHILDRTHVLYTDSLVKHGLTKSTQINYLPVQGVAGGKVSPTTVSASVVIEELTLKSIEVPVQTFNVPRGLSLITFPSTIRLTCQLPIGRFAALSPNNFVVGVDYNKLSAVTRNQVEVEILRKPNYIHSCQLSPSSVEFILEEKQTSLH